MFDVLGNGTILGYCTNVHAGATYAQTRENLRRYALPVKRRVCPEGVLGVGLWLSATAAREALQQDRVAELRDWLQEQGLAVFTLNGFPYGDFHQASVKHRVYHPNWTQQARYDYTLDLIRILSELLPEGAEGSISTLPVGWGSDWDKAGRQAAADRLLDLVHQLARVELDTGRYIHIDLEPEPGCLLQTSADVVAFFKQYLLDNPDELSVRAYLKVCHDVCHAAVMFEDQAAALATYREAGIKVGKVQISSAIRVDFDAMAADQRRLAADQLRMFCEQRYLHQTVVRKPAGNSVAISERTGLEKAGAFPRQAGGYVAGNSGGFYEDLPDALANEADPGAGVGGQWRVHFHVPVFLEKLDHLGTTRDAIGQCLGAIWPGDGVHHFEVETYAWDVLPAAHKEDDLAAGIARELEWVRGEFG